MKLYFVRATDRAGRPQLLLEQAENMEAIARRTMAWPSIRIRTVRDLEATFHVKPPKQAAGMAMTPLLWRCAAILVLGFLAYLFVNWVLD